MPTYEYECQKCGYRFEVFQQMSDMPLLECEKCSGTLKRLIFGGSGIIFKGSGFYVNDNSKTKKSTQTKKTESISSKKPEEKVKKIDEKK